MDVINIAKFIKSMTWFIVGLVILPVGIAVLWLLILMLISINLENGTTFGFITTYLVVFIGITITTGTSLWFKSIVKNVLAMTNVRDIIQNVLQERMDKTTKNQK